MGFALPFNSPEEQDDSEDILLLLLGVNCRLNKLYLARHPGTPLLYDSGVVYTPPDQADGRPPLKKSTLKKLLALLKDEAQIDPETAMMIVRLIKGVEIFLDIPNLYRRGKGDCNELVPVRIAELWRAGVPASPYLVKEPNDRGGITYHAIVQHPDGSAEDPSRILGMGGPMNNDLRREEIRKNAERQANYVVEAQQLIETGVASPQKLARQLNAMGLAPSSGVFRSPYGVYVGGARRAA
ncbi:MAG TPA: hypothetical protein VFI56_24275 [Vicinamibacterales bacterium]|nr:hypothetical protein [Vicinamibacterales bacterium]